MGWLIVSNNGISRIIYLQWFENDTNTIGSVETADDNKLFIFFTFPFVIDASVCIYLVQVFLCLL